MDTDIVQAAAHYAQSKLGDEAFRYVSAVVANCKLLALQLEAQEGYTTPVDMEALVIAAYLHDISIGEYGLRDHQRTSAALAVEFLRAHGVTAERIKKVEQAILLHTEAVPAVQHSSIPPEGLILYDANNLGRLSGSSVVTALIQFGSSHPNVSLSGEGLAQILRHIEERFIELYHSLNTQPARELAREKFNNTLAFLDGVIEHLSDATPV
jgi:HD superfamily phosphodiesterase